MRVLIADRNARLLESIARTFARRFAIQTATSCEQCNDLLAQGEFDLVLISEKLSDGLGLRLLGQIARSSPDTLRVFAARRSRLQLLKGKLGPFGLFRTLGYPINPQELLSTLTLAQTGLAIGAAAPGAPDVAPQVDPPSASSPPRPPSPSSRPGASSPPSRPAPAAATEMPPIVERISLTAADATFTINVPQAILLKRRVRRPNLPPAARPVQAARPESVAAPQPAEPQRAQAQRAQPEPVRAQPPVPPAQPRIPVARAAAPPLLPSQSGASRQPARRHRAANTPVADQVVYPIRSKIVLAATSVVVFLVTTVTLNLNDASVHVTHASTPRAVVELPAPPARNETPVAMTTAFHPDPSVMRRVEPKPAVERAAPQIAASTPRMADPASFSSEAYEPIYSD